jgi:rhodanese-related sulfurtransferase
VAAEFLSEQGVDAVNVAGGTKAWVESGRAAVEGADPS